MWCDETGITPLPPKFSRYACAAGGSDRSGIIRDLPLMPQIGAGCSPGASTPPPPVCCFVLSVLTGGQLPAKL